MPREPFRPCLGSRVNRTGHVLVPAGNRCPACKRDRNQERDATRGTPAERSYGHEHRRIRTELLPDAYGTPCPRCREPMLPGESLDLGHSDPGRKRAGLPGDRIEHATCNRSNRPTGRAHNGRTP